MLPAWPLLVKCLLDGCQETHSICLTLAPLIVYPVPASLTQLMAAQPVPSFLFLSTPRAAESLPAFAALMSLVSVPENSVVSSFSQCCRLHWSHRTDLCEKASADVHRETGSHGLALADLELGFSFPDSDFIDIWYLVANICF